MVLKDGNLGHQGRTDGEGVRSQSCVNDEKDSRLEFKIESLTTR